MVCLSQSGRFGSIKQLWYLVPVLILTLRPAESPGQDNPCSDKYSSAVSRAASLISAGRYDVAGVLLGQVQKEIATNCPADSGIRADIAYLSGNISLLQDDPVQALLFFHEARDLATGLLQLSRIDQNTGAVWFAENDYVKAVRYFSHALSELESSGAFLPKRQLALYDNLGSACFENNDLKEAGRWWNMSQQVAGDLLPPDSMTMSRIVHNSGLVLFGLKEWHSSAEEFRRAMELNPRKGMPYDKFTAMITKNLALALVQMGETGEARKLIGPYLDRAHEPGPGDPVFIAEILRLNAWISFAEGRMSEAGSMLDAGLRLMNDKSIKGFPGLAGMIRFRILRDRASILWLRHERDPDDPAVSVDSIYCMQQKAFGALDAFRTRDGSLPGFLLLHDSLEVLLNRTLETGYTLMAGRKGTVEELISFVETVQSYPKRPDAAVGKMTCDSVSDSLVRRWLTLNRKLYLVEKRMVEGADPQQETVGFNLRNELDSITDKLILSGRIDPETLTHPGMKTGNICSRLSSSEAVLDYVVCRDRLYVFVLRDVGATLVATNTGVDFPEECRGLIASLGTADDAAVREISRQISKSIVRPVIPFLKGCGRLYVVPGRTLAGLPFECLSSEVSGNGHAAVLAEKFSISYHTSIAEITPDSLFMVNAKKVWQTRNPFDYISFAPSSASKPGQVPLVNNESEAAEIGKMFSSAGLRAKVLTGNEADETALLEELPGGTIIHIATHSRVDRSHPERSGLELWKRSPETTGDELLDGILEMGEVRGLRLNCELLTLSSCTLDQGPDRVHQNLRPVEADFLDAGAQSVLSSLWNVSDRHTRTLMCDFYRYYLDGNTFAEALRKAKMKMMFNPATSSPYFWAPFILTSK
jgi:CHAT domain-containing protein/tetratricopeptide (TPR) repeat protein